MQANGKAGFAWVLFKTATFIHIGMLQQDYAIYLM